MHIKEASILYEPYIYSNARGHIILQQFFHFDGNQHIVFKRNEYELQKEALREGNSHFI